MLIRHADPEHDAAACAAIYAPFVYETAVSFEQDVPTTDTMAARMAATTPRYPWLVAERAGDIAGFAYAAQHRSRAAYRWAVDVAIYLGPTHRGHGVSRSLYGALLELLERQGIHSACAGITLPNPASVALHESLGFAPVGIYRRIGYKAGAWRDVGWWQRELTPASNGPPPEPGPPARLPSQPEVPRGTSG